MESKEEFAPTEDPLAASQNRVDLLDLEIIDLLRRRSWEAAAVRGHRMRKGVPGSELARENRCIRMYTDLLGPRGAQIAGALLGMAAGTTADTKNGIKNTEIGLRELAADTELWPLVRRLVTTGGMTGTLTDWLGYPPGLELVGRSVRDIPENLRSVLHGHPGEQAQERNIRFRDRQGTVLVCARAVALLDRLPETVRTRLTDTQTPLGPALAELHPKRHLLRWNATAGADGRAELLRITARLDGAGVPLAWVSECLRLRELDRVHTRPVPRGL